MMKRMPWLLPLAVVAAVAGGVWWFVFRESAEERGQKLLDAAAIAMKTQDFATAEKRLLEVLEIQPHNGLLHHNLGVLYFQQKRLPEARAQFLAAAESYGPQANELRAEEYFQLATLSYLDKNWPQAARELGTAIESHPQRAQLHTRLLDLQVGRMGDLAAGDSTVARFLRLCGNNTANLESAAFVYYQNKLYDRAESLAREATAISDSAYSAYGLAARSQWRQGKLREGLRSLDEPLARHPSAAPLWVTRGLLLSEDGKQQEALAAADRAVQLDPQDYEAHKLRQKVLAEMSRLPEALQEVEAAMRLTQDPAEQRQLAAQQQAMRSVLQQTGGTSMLPGGTPPAAGGTPAPAPARAPTAAPAPGAAPQP